MSRDDEGAGPEEKEKVDAMARWADEGLDQE